MSKYFFVLTMLVCSFAYGQNTFKVVIKNGETNDNLIGATAQLVNSSNGAIANEQGFGYYFRNDETAGIIDDHKYVNELAKIPMIDIIDRTNNTPSGFGAYWHTHQDDMKMIDKKTLKAVGQTLLHTIYRFDANKGI
jgi:hypothetical protein